MAAVSVYLLVAAIVGYLVAMVAGAVQYALSSRPVSALPAGEARSVSTAPVPQPAAARLPWSRVMGIALLVAAVLHLATAVTRGIAAQRVPWGNMYEYLLTATLVGIVAWLYVVRRYPSLRRLGLYVAMVNSLLLGLAWMVYTPVGPLVPALDSYWLIIHVAAAMAATGLFLVGFIAATLQLVRMGYERGRIGFPFTLGARLPETEALERLAFRMHAIAFPIWTFAVVAGAIWAEAAWGRYWGWDPKEVWAFISWVLYAAYLHARATPSVRRTVVAGLAIAGWLTMLMNLFGVNLFFEGLHSYA